MRKLGMAIAVLLIFSGLVALLGFWPVSLILAGIALLLWILSRD